MAMPELDFTNLDPATTTNLKIIKDEVNTKPKMTVSAAAPSGGSSGDLHVDTATNRLYANVAGTWKYTTLIT